MVDHDITLESGVTLDGLDADGNRDQAHEASEEDNSHRAAAITDAMIASGEDDGIGSIIPVGGVV